jgi:hypothetical protein
MNSNCRGVGARGFLLTLAARYGVCQPAACRCYPQQSLGKKLNAQAFDVRKLPMANAISVCGNRKWRP